MIVEKFEAHETLNNKLWDEDNKLITSVRERILKIVEQFLSSCELPLPLVDIHIVGSQASYNYTNHSDLDVHLIANFELVDASKEILQTAYNSIKTKFNSDYDITIKGIDVELYVEDINSTVMSNGIYSVCQDCWIKFPKRLTDIRVPDVSEELAVWKERIEKAVSTNSSNKIEQLINDIYLVRKNSLDVEGEYGSGNQLFKEIRNSGLLDLLKQSYKESRSKELSLESLQKNSLVEASRSSLLAKSKQNTKGFERFKKRVKSRVANSVKQYNSIDMNKLFKEDILTADINVKGETDNYVVRISFGGFLELLQDQLKKQNNEFNYKAVTRALINGFNKDDVYISCNCADWQYRFSYFATRNNITSGAPENRPSDITNPDDNLGSACKHVLLVLSNTSFLLKISSTIHNYVNYMQKHYEKLYADIIYPAIYGKPYEDPVQLTIDSEGDKLDTDSETIDKSNEFARTKSLFQKGNKQGIRFGSSKDTPINTDNTDEQGIDLGSTAD